MSTKTGYLSSHIIVWKDSGPLRESSGPGALLCWVAELIQAWAEAPVQYFVPGTYFQ